MLIWSAARVRTPRIVQKLLALCRQSASWNCTRILSNVPEVLRLLNQKLIGAVHIQYDMCQSYFQHEVLELEVSADKHSHNSAQLLRSVLRFAQS